MAPTTEPEASAPTAETTEATEQPSEPTAPADEHSTQGAYCTIPKAVLPVTELESDPDGGDDTDTDTVDGRLEDGVCVPDPEPES